MYAPDQGQRTAIPTALYTTRTPTRCRGIHFFEGRYRVLIKCRGKLHHGGAFRTMPEAVKAITFWYAERFGPHWEYVARVREANPWRIVQGKRGIAAGRHLLYVWLFGKRHRVDPTGGIGWHSYAAANAARPFAIDAFLHREFTRRKLPLTYLETHPVLWRIVGEQPPEPKPGSVWWCPQAQETHSGGSTREKPAHQYHRLQPASLGQRATG